MMFWYVNPLNSNKAVNLGVIKTISMKQNMIFLDEYTWVFETKKQATKVYEEIIKLVQEYRYRKAIL